MYTYPCLLSARGWDLDWEWKLKYEAWGLGIGPEDSGLRLDWNSELVAFNHPLFPRLSLIVFHSHLSFTPHAHTPFPHSPPPTFLFTPSSRHVHRHPCCPAIFRFPPRLRIAFPATQNKKGSGSPAETLSYEFLSLLVARGTAESTTAPTTHGGTLSTDKPSYNLLQADR